MLEELSKNFFVRGSEFKSLSARTEVGSSPYLSSVIPAAALSLQDQKEVISVHLWVLGRHSNGWGIKGEERGFLFFAQKYVIEKKCIYLPISPFISASINTFEYFLCTKYSTHVMSLCWVFILGKEVISNKKKTFIFIVVPEEWICLVWN